MVSLTYTYNYHKEGCPPYYPCETNTISEKFSGSANLTPTLVGVGYEGVGAGSYEYVNDRIVSPYQGCPEGDNSHLAYSGEADMIVHYQFSINNDVTGGPDTSMYNSSYGVVEAIIEDNDLHVEGSSRTCLETESWSSDDGQVGFACHFYSLDFVNGGTFTQTIEMPDDSTATCVLNIEESGEKMHIFGTVKGLFGIEGAEGLPNSRVVLANMDKDHYEKLSTSKPDFIKKTMTANNYTADYEFNFNKRPGDLPKMMVVSLLWYDGGKPEFAITNGKELDGRFIPVYQALCVDDDDSTKCAKWQRKSDGSYEAEVNFEYGSEEKLLETAEFMEPEDWMGTNLLHTGGPISGGNARISASGTTMMMADSAYMYYESYRAFKYIETLGLRSALNPFLIRSHDFDPKCGDGTAWFNHKYLDSGLRRSFGDLGALTERVEATGGEVVMCNAGGHSSLYYYRAPDLPLWHEIGHYLQFQMYDPITPLRGTPHFGYKNDSTNDSIIEGFAGFVTMLIHKHYGLPFPEVYNSVNLEMDTKIWGDYQEEEEAVAGILWDFQDGGREINLGYTLNGTSLPISRVYQASTDDVSLDESLILQVIERNQIKTLVDLYSAFVSTRISAVDLDMIYVNHGVFADVENRNYVHDSVNEKIRESGSKSSPVRLHRNTPPPDIPGSYIIADADSTLNFTIMFDEPYSSYDYSYQRQTNAGEKMYFRMPPEYYPSTLVITEVRGDEKPLNVVLKIDSDEYWAYINSNPPEDSVFKRISVHGDTHDSLAATQYIQNVKDLLSRVSEEYNAGNATGAEELATIAYIDNFEHVEAELDRHNATDLGEQTEEMLRVELIGLIRDRADSQTVDNKIAEINARLDEAIVIVPEFSQGMVIAMLGLMSLIVLVFARHTGRIGFRIR